MVSVSSTESSYTYVFKVLQTVYPSCTTVVVVGYIVACTGMRKWVGRLTPQPAELKNA